MVSYNNDGIYYEIAFDTAKEGGELRNLNDYFKARVGDNGTPLVVRFYTQGLLNQFKGTEAPIVEGDVGNFTIDTTKTGSDQLVMAPDAQSISWKGDKSNMLPGGRILYKLPAQLFPQSGAFKGFLGYVDDSDGERRTGVNIWFRVLDGPAQMGKAVNVYISELDAAIHNANEQIRQQGISYQEAYNKLQNDFKVITQQALSDLRGDYSHKVTDVSNALDTSLAAFNKLTASVGVIQGQIDARNIVSQQDFDKQAQALKSSITDTLSKVKFNAQGFANADQIKSTYPNGAEGIFIAVDTGHQWYWVDNSWVDAGPFQAEKNPEVEDARTWAQSNGSGQSASLGKAIRDQFDQVNQKIKDHHIIDTAVAPGPIPIRDSQGNLLVDNDENVPVGNIYLPVTDRGGTQNYVPADSGMVGQTFLMHLRDYGLPIMYLDYPDLEKLQNKASGSIEDKVRYSFQGTSGILEKIKIQGNTSQGFPKKNYSLKFDQSIELKEGWGTHKNYVIKADWVDFSQIRNELGAKIWGQIRRTRIMADRDTLVDGSDNQLVNTSGDTFAGETTQAFANLNFGSIDAYPIFVVINGMYWGLYSMTAPKDDWIVNMGNGGHEAMISAEAHGPVTGFKQETMPDASGNLNGEDFAIEYVSDEDDQTWVTQKLNAAIDACLAHYDDDATYVNEISKHIDLDSAIDYYIFSALTANLDGTTKNFLLNCWHQADPWHFAAYDMDATFGNNWDGKHIFASSHQPDFAGFATNSRLMEVIYKHDKQALINRYQELRKGPLSESNLHDTISDYAIKIPKAAYDYEVKRWPSRPGTALNDAQQILSWINQRLNYLDQQITTLAQK